ncbi:hypothetical protein ACFLXU_05915 [Chloroflexota bacterium]
MRNLRGKREKKILFYLADAFEKEHVPWVGREKLGEYLGGREGIFEAIEAIFVLNMFGFTEYHPQNRHKVMISQEGLKYVNKLKLRLESKRLFSLRNLSIVLIVFVTAVSALLIVAIVTGWRPW